MPPGLRDHGGVEGFSGKAVVAQCDGTDPMARKILNEEGTGKVLAVDGGASLKRALIDDLLAELAVKRGWSGMVIDVCVRDASEIEGMDAGIEALTFPGAVRSIPV